MFLANSTPDIPGRPMSVSIRLKFLLLASSNPDSASWAVVGLQCTSLIIDLATILAILLSSIIRISGAFGMISVNEHSGNSGVGDKV